MNYSKGETKIGILYRLQLKSNNCSCMHECANIYRHINYTRMKYIHTLE